MYAIKTSGVLGSGVSVVTFSSIPQTFTHLQIRGFARCTASSNQQSWQIQLNSDVTSGNYTIHRSYNQGNSTSPSQSFYTGQSWMISSTIPCANDTANVYGVFMADILDYTNTNKFKTYKSIGGSETNVSSGGTGEIHLTSGMWKSTAAVSTITITSPLSSNFVQYSKFDLYGLVASNATGA
jgi:hypothetical protein